MRRNDLAEMKELIEMGYHDGYSTTNYNGHITESVLERISRMNVANKTHLHEYFLEKGLSYDEGMDLFYFEFEGKNQPKVDTLKQVLSEVYSFMSSSTPDWPFKAMAMGINLNDLITGVREVHKLLLLEAGIKVSTGSKWTKVLSKIAQHERLQGTHMIYYINGKMEQVSTECYPKPVKERIYISLRVNDFLRMSMGNSWSSCHDIRGGGYQAGTLSLALDTSSFLIFQNASKVNELKWRILAHVLPHETDDNHSILCNVNYGDGSSREMVLRELYRILGANDFQLIADVKIRPYRVSTEGHGYRDYESKVSTLIYDVESKVFPDLTIGFDAPCVNCGGYLNRGDSLLCEDCLETGYTCGHCGDRIPNGDEYYIDGYGYVCGDCAYICPHCNEAHLERNMTEVNTGQMVCNFCLEDYYYLCESCGEWVHENKVTWLDNEKDEETGDHILEGWYCDSCL